MSTYGKNLNYFLMDGSSSGRVKVSLVNWSGVAYRIPRTMLDACKDRDDLAYSGVYFLFGVIGDAEEDAVYIGQAGARKNGEGILYRLQEHRRNQDKDYWREAVVFTTSNNTLGQTEISYLEHRFYGLAKSADRYKVMNGNDPMCGHLTEEKVSEMEEYIDVAKEVMGILGHRVFEPYVENSTNALSVAQSAPTVPAATLFCTRNGAQARGKVTSEGFVVLAGSKLSDHPTNSCPDSAKAARARYADDIISNTLQRDVYFKSPSGASNFVLLASSNGNVEWREAGGKTLRDLEYSDSVENGSQPPVIEAEPEDNQVEVLFFCTRRGAKAKGRATKHRFTVLAGSLLAAQPTDSCPDSARSARNRYSDAIRNLVLQRDIVFSSFSSASCFVLLASSNGRADWRTADGKTYSQVFNEN
ncbi:GIY-YIG nuclease family protein [Bacillota bacterium Meth-B3]